jgi:hypothetical protein
MRLRRSLELRCATETQPKLTGKQATKVRGGRYFETLNIEYGKLNIYIGAFSEPVLILNFITRGAASDSTAAYVLS